MNKLQKGMTFEPSKALEYALSNPDLARTETKASNVNPDKVNILGINFPVLDYQTSLALFKHWINLRKPHQVCLANVHTTVVSLTDPELKAINNHAVTLMDGLPLVWYTRAVHKVHVKERVCGPELMLRCLEEGRAFGWKHYFLGGKENVLTDLVAAMQARYPGANIIGWYSPPFRPLTTEEDDQLVAQINGSQADFLWVSLGAPKQEKWIAAHITKINVPVQIGVGAAFNFNSGHLSRAPLWMQKSGLEWLYRMTQEPRLIKRYCSTNPVFLALFLKDIIKVNFLRLFAV